MITLPEYTVMGEDGQEYGPVPDDQIRRWVAEGRLERKTPVKTAGSRDWVFLETLPEFAGVFLPPAPPPKAPQRKCPVAVVVILAAGLVWLAFKKFNPH